MSTDILNNINKKSLLSDMTHVLKRNHQKTTLILSLLSHRLSSYALARVSLNM